MAMNFCSNCGAKLRPDAKFCGSCGKKILRDEEPVDICAPKDDPPIDERNLPPPRTMADILSEANQDYRPQTNRSTFRRDVTLQENFLSLDGRLNRMRYFKRWLAVDVVGFIVGMIVAVACLTPSDQLTPTGEMLVTAVGAVVLIPKFFLDVRRIKDIGKSDDFAKGLAGLVAALGLAQTYLMIGRDLLNAPPVAHSVGVLSSIIFIWMQATSGTVGPNQHGADPLER